MEMEGQGVFTSERRKEKAEKIRVRVDLDYIMSQRRDNIQNSLGSKRGHSVRTKNDC